MARNGYAHVTRRCKASIRRQPPAEELVLLEDIYSEIVRPPKHDARQEGGQ
jgi:hypothetical protein